MLLNKIFIVIESFSFFLPQDIIISQHCKYIVKLCFRTRVKKDKKTHYIISKKLKKNGMIDF